MFCIGWIDSACKLLEKYDRPASLDGYMQKNHSDLTDLDARDRTDRAGRRGFDDMEQGYVAGKSARLHDGVSAGPQRKAIGA